jgi:hypothetical protein
MFGEGSYGQGKKIDPIERIDFKTQRYNQQVVHVFG